MVKPVHGSKCCGYRDIRKGLADEGILLVRRAEYGKVQGLDGAARSVEESFDAVGRPAYGWC